MIQVLVICGATGSALAFFGALWLWGWIDDMKETLRIEKANTVHWRDCWGKLGLKYDALVADVGTERANRVEAERAAKETKGAK